ncbi:pleckstrin homology domain-containing family A member 1-like isoform X2 [Acanthaster planci]|uniref:Pleckstrin homology domain-containing family A member 1-like isoform X2 n=1 Tax=Acanthaster planci TaxID=133434 RepID=A0A8B7Z014_ACAPL|nr:pleckstrin homology domain-containing family A member 1-like isoform X2 [Acanthaster planci]
MPYMDRQGRTCGFMDLEDPEQNGRFFRRYFLIDQEKGQLLWYMDNPSNLPDGTSHVDAIQLSQISNARDATKQRPKVPFCFVVSVPSRSYYFRADNQQDMEEWVLSLNKACRVTVPVTDASKVSTPLKLDIGKANSQANSSPKSPVRGISYTTEIVGGVVHRKPVETVHSDTDSEDESASLRARSWPRSVSPSGGSEKSLSRIFPGRNVIKAGWCVKQGALRKSWKRRFFILDDEGLAYYKSSTDKLPLKTISKKDITVSRMSDSGQALQRDNLFEIVSLSRTFFVQAYSPDDMAEWINSINEVKNPKRASAPQASLKLSLISKLLDCKREASAEGKPKTPRTPHESERTITYTKPHNIEIRVHQPPEDSKTDETSTDPWERDTNRAMGSESGGSGRNSADPKEVIMDFVRGPETSL